MSASTTTTRAIAFLGATGGCTLPVLERTIRAGHHATALARDPEKLRKLLVETRGVPASVVSSNLTIVPGSAADEAAFRQLLVAPGKEKELVDTIVSGIGSLPKVNWTNPIHPFTLHDPQITETAMRSVQNTLRALQAEGYRVPGSQSGKPIMIVISTTGLSKQQRDVPVAFLAFYHWALAVPHKDKAKMEQMVIASKKEGLIQDLVIVRPSLLMDGDAKGLDAVRVGWEGADAEGERQGPGPAIGYTITREDVAAWIWEEAVLKPNEWKGKAVSLTN